MSRRQFGWSQEELASFDLLRIDAWAVRGFALGTASHGIGAARAIQVHADAGAYAGFGGALAVCPTRMIAQGVYRIPSIRYDVAVAYLGIPHA